MLFRSSSAVRLGMLAFAVSLVAASGVDAAAKPASKTPPKSSAKESPPKGTAKTTIASSETLPKIQLAHDETLVKRVKGVGALTKARKLELLLKAGIETGELAAPVRLTIRDMFANWRTHLSLIGSIAVLPGEEGGIAHIDGGLMLPRSFSPFAGFGSESTEPYAAMNFALVEFRAAPSKHYIVDCIAVGDGEFATQVLVDTSTVLEGGFTYTEGHAIQLVPSATSARKIQVQLLSNQPWTMRLCEITPVG